MEDLLRLIETYWFGFILLLVALVVLSLITIRFLNLFGITVGYSQVLNARLRFRNAISKIFTEIIDEFRHVVAVVVLALFLIVFIITLLSFAEEADQRMQALNLMLTTFSGIIGTIVGFYFSEKGKQGNNLEGDIVTDEDLVQGDRETITDSIEEISKEDLGL
jgi:purine-cytosine permease-like protein